MKRSPLDFGDLWVGEPEPEAKPRLRDLAAALVVFIGLPCAIAYVAVSLYLGGVR